MYTKPTEKQVQNALKNGWTEEQARRGYDIVEYGRGMFEIERIDDVFANSEVSDDDCSIEAAKSGFCKIIPVEELPENFDRRYFGWVDTPENRMAIENYCDELSKDTSKEEVERE